MKYKCVSSSERSLTVAELLWNIWYMPKTDGKTFSSEFHIDWSASPDRMALLIYDIINIWYMHIQYSITSSAVLHKMACPRDMEDCRQGPRSLQDSKSNTHSQTNPPITKVEWTPFKSYSPLDSYLSLSLPNSTQVHNTFPSYLRYQYFINLQWQIYFNAPSTSTQRLIGQSGWWHTGVQSGWRELYRIH